MRRPLGVLFSSLALTALTTPIASPLAAQPAPAGAPVNMEPIPTISVTGMGEAQVTPDRARLSVGVQTQAPTAAEASTRNARLQQAVIDALRGLNIPATQIRTTGYNVSPEQVFDPQGRRPRITGYNVQNTVVVELSRVDQVGPALDAVLAKGANVVSSLQFYSSQEAVVRRRALQNAIERARADAEAMAAAAGGRLGALLDLSTGSGVRPQPVYAGQVAMARVAADAVPTPISEGEQTISAVVSARYQFVPAKAP